SLPASCRAAPAWLSSSPTGRSSDLGSQAAMAGTADDVQLLLAGQVDELDRVAGNTDGEVGVLFLFGVLHGVDQLFLAKDVDVQRSGEHTSELESRFDLVCRLLLEYH